MQNNNDTWSSVSLVWIECHHETDISIGTPFKSRGLYHLMDRHRGLQWATGNIPAMHIVEHRSATSTRKATAITTITTEASLVPLIFNCIEHHVNHSSWSQQVFQPVSSWYHRTFNMQHHTLCLAEWNIRSSCWFPNTTLLPYKGACMQQIKKS